MWAPELGQTISCTDLSSILRTESVKGPVALITDLAKVFQLSPVISSVISETNIIFNDLGIRDQCHKFDGFGNSNRNKIRYLHQ